MERKEVKSLDKQGAVAKDTSPVALEMFLTFIASYIAKVVKQSFKTEFTGLLREKHPRNDGSVSFAIAFF